MPEPVPLCAIVASPGYADRVSAAAERIASAPDPATAQRLLVDGIAVLGAQNAFFASFVRDGKDLGACRFMLVCEPDGCRPNLDGDALLHDPWLAYATRHAAPIVASSMLWAADHGGHELIAPAHRHGFASTLLVPAHSAPGHLRIGLLALGSHQAGFFEGEGLSRFRIGARAMATELHDWWQARLGRELIARSRITSAELELLRHEHHGHSSKLIARALDVSPRAIDSRFQRITARLGVSNRRAAVRLAVECGLLAAPESRDVTGLVCSEQPRFELDDVQGCWRL
jgi:DNA-binding CsgD family transcriptional regulator